MIPKIYVESCPIIDLGKHKAEMALEPIREQNVDVLLKFLEAARAKDVELYTSIISISECTQVEPGKPQPDKKVQAFFEELLTSGTSGITLVQLTFKINVISRDLRWKNGISLKGMDSIHLASAIAMGCSELITTDGKLHKAAASIKQKISIIQACKSKLLPSEYAEMELEEYGKKRKKD